MATNGSTSLRVLVAALLMIVASACTGSSESTSAGSTSSSSTSSDTPSETPVTEGISFGPFGTSPSVTVLAGLPDGWEDNSDFGAMSGPDPAGSEAPDGVAVLFFTADSLYSDPCHWDVAGTGAADAGDVEVGPSVDDLVAAVGENTFYTSTDPTPVTIDGYAGQQLEIQLPDDPFTDCDLESGDTSGHAYVFPLSVYVQGPANVWDLTILDVDGTRLVAAILSFPETSQDDLDAARNVVETMDIQI